MPRAFWAWYKFGLTSSYFVILEVVVDEDALRKYIREQEKGKQG
jgi:hypothetical protein